MAFSRHLEQRPCGVEMFDCNAHQTYWQKNLIPTVDHNGHDLDSFLTAKGPEHLAVHHELICITKYFCLKYEAIFLTAKAFLKLGYATGQFSQA